MKPTRQKNSSNFNKTPEVEKCFVLARLSFNEKKGFTIGQAKVALQELHELERVNYFGIVYDAHSECYDVLIIRNTHYLRRSNDERYASTSKLLLWKRKEF